MLLATNPDVGINQVSPMYWAWRAASEHALARYDDELLSAAQEARRFPGTPTAAMSRARAYAAMGRIGSLASVLGRAGLNTAVPGWGARNLALIAGRELRAHGHEGHSAALFKRVAALPVGGKASRGELHQHALALYESGALPEARTAYASLASNSSGDIEAVGRIGAIAARTGDSATVRVVDQRLREWRMPYAFGAPTWWRAHLAALSGNGGEAVTLLHSAMQQGARPTDIGIVTLHEDGDFKALWKEASFRELIRPREGQATIP